MLYNADAPRPSRETDECTPLAAYPASKLAAEALLRSSRLTWAILRLPFVYGDGDGHLASMPALARRFGLHHRDRPARRDPMVPVQGSLRV